MKGPVIEVSDLTKGYSDGALAVDHVSFCVHSGEVFCLLGATGAGRSSIVNIILNFTPPTSGFAQICGYDCTKESLKAREQLCYIPENLRLYTTLTARQNLVFFVEGSGRTGLKKGNYNSAMRSVGLPESLFNRAAGQCSRGMRQKLGLCMAILRGVPAIIMDEPIVGLGPLEVAEFLAEVRKICELGRTVLLTTHDVFTARHIADRVAILKRGRMVAIRDKCDFERRDIEEIYLRDMRFVEPS